jgi:hypothetical protein
MTGSQIAALALASGLTPESDPIDAHRETLRVTPYRGELAVKPL